METITHLNEKDTPHMVNVGEKQITHRTAKAISTVLVTPAMAQLFNGSEIASKKQTGFVNAVLRNIGRGIQQRCVPLELPA